MTLVSNHPKIIGDKIAPCRTPLRKFTLCCYSNTIAWYRCTTPVLFYGHPRSPLLLGKRTTVATLNKKALHIVISMIRRLCIWITSSWPCVSVRATRSLRAELKRIYTTLFVPAWRRCNWTGVITLNKDVKNAFWSPVLIKRKFDVDKSTHPMIPSQV